MNDPEFDRVYKKAWTLAREKHPAPEWVAINLVVNDDDTIDMYYKYGEASKKYDGSLGIPLGKHEPIK